MDNNHFGVVTGIFLLLFSLAFQARASFVAFESGHVRPLAMSPDTNRLFAVNTPDNRLEIFTITQSGLTLTNAADLLVAVRISLGFLTATELQLAHGDLYPVAAPDGKINLQDLILLQKLVLQ